MAIIHILHATLLNPTICSRNPPEHTPKAALASYFPEYYLLDVLSHHLLPPRTSEHDMMPDTRGATKDNVKFRPRLRPTDVGADILKGATTHVDTVDAK
mmetsp:Transcript_26317/g.57733  ORF Transcript_26317/g.57733 Transcript_26317/m.57733 type:complete len:99 (+) Transcript_26317:68-364(+)